MPPCAGCSRLRSGLVFSTIPTGAVRRPCPLPAFLRPGANSRARRGGGRLSCSPMTSILPLVAEPAPHRAHRSARRCPRRYARTMVAGRARFQRCHDPRRPCGGPARHRNCFCARRNHRGGGYFGHRRRAGDLPRRRSHCFKPWRSRRHERRSGEPGEPRFARRPERPCGSDFRDRQAGRRDDFLGAAVNDLHHSRKSPGFGCDLVSRRRSRQCHRRRARPGHTIPPGGFPSLGPAMLAKCRFFSPSGQADRPANPDNHYTSKYLDMPVEPLFPFGHGLSYSRFTLHNPRVNKQDFTAATN